MEKDDLKRKKYRVSKDFEATLNNLIRSLSNEEINIMGAYEKPDERKDFFRLSENELSSDIPEGNRSVYRNKSFNKYELVVDSTTNTLKGNQNLASAEEKVFTRPILKSEVSKDSKVPTKHKTSKYLQRFFPTFNHMNIPFERTGIQSLAYHLHIEIENGKTVVVRVKEFDTINKLKRKIKSISVERQALFYQGERLEGSSMLYSSGIKSNSQVQLKLCHVIKIHGVYDSTRIILSIYTTLTVYELKIKFGVHPSIAIDVADIVLKYKGTLLENDKELFVYDVRDGEEIEITKIVRRKSISNIAGEEVVNKYLKMTNNLTICTCKEMRLDAMSKLFKLTSEEHSSKTEKKSYGNFLKEFDKERNYHHMACFKLKYVKKEDRLLSEDSSISGITSTSYPGSDSSLKSAVLAETMRVERHLSLRIETDYIKLLADSKDFKIFKHLLQVKIGTVCNLRSVALLYKYCRATVRYIGLDEKEKNDEVDKILEFTKFYFKKYFMMDIINKGGLDALTLSGSDIDD